MARSSPGIETLQMGSAMAAQAHHGSAGAHRDYRDGWRLDADGVGLMLFGVNESWTGGCLEGLETQREAFIGVSKSFKFDRDDERSVSKRFRNHERFRNRLVNRSSFTLKQVQPPARSVTRGAAVQRPLLQGPSALRGTKRGIVNASDVMHAHRWGAQGRRASTW